MPRLRRTEFRFRGPTAIRRGDRFSREI
jgi:hypothetical protein